MRKLLVLLVAAAFVVSFSTPAMAETSFYGQVRMKTYMASQDEDAGDDSDMNWILDNGASRFGAKFKADDVSANVEIRPNNGSYFRHWVGKWNFGGGTLVVGQTWTPTFQPIDESVLGGGVASVGGSLRQPQIGLEMGSLTVALRQPSSSAVITTSADIDTAMPAVEASYELAAGPAGITLFLGYNAYDDLNAAEDAYNIASTLIGGNVALSFGAVGVKVSVWTSANGGQGGFGYEDAQYDAAADEIKDATTLGYELTVSYKISDTMGFNLGYGATNDDVDDASDTDTETATYVNLPITLAKNVKLVPEVLMLDHGVSLTGAEEGTETRIGARWRINF